ncbi:MULTISPECIES: hypothetical protein [unclassified Streptomyces]|jgi:hypothetical protein|uniref:Uncharacterized protein n=1 Tax=Streptomyces thermocoprophilus TaxID=78356 RepID=A0ABV5VJA1_9ACTN
MPVAEIALAVVGLGVEQLVQWRFGPMGVMALVLLGIGLRARSSTYTSLGAVVLVLLMVQS